MERDLEPRHGHPAREARRAALRRREGGPGRGGRGGAREGWGWRGRAARPEPPRAGPLEGAGGAERGRQRRAPSGGRAQRGPRGPGARAARGRRGRPGANDRADRGAARMPGCRRRRPCPYLGAQLGRCLHALLRHGAGAGAGGEPGSRGRGRGALDGGGWPRPELGAVAAAAAATTAARQAGSLQEAAEARGVGRGWVPSRDPQGCGRPEGGRAGGRAGG